MNGVRFHYDALEGQKTGAFLDQRENYAAAARMRAAKRWTFSATRAASRCTWPSAVRKVTGVDSSRPALEVAERNAALNGREIEWIEGQRLRPAAGLCRCRPPL